MKFIKSEVYEEISLGKEEGCVFFDCDTGNTIVLDDVATDILDCFKNGRDPESVINLLSEMYEEERSVIESDVKELIGRLTENGLLKVVEESKIK